MGKKILGLRIGINYIGWAVITSGKILGMGTRVFPPAVDNIGQGIKEVSKRSVMSQFLAERRLRKRRKLKKRFLIKILLQHQMFPKVNIRHWGKSSFFNSREMNAWKKMNPYELRTKALHEKITLLQLGRIFYHMCQRRGFQSNSRDQLSDENGKIYKGVPKEGKTGINATTKAIGEGTLGSYLYSIHPKKNEPYKVIPERIRNRYTLRQMYIDEFEKIWEKQKTFHPTVLTDELKAIIGGRKKDGYPINGALFFQRPLKSTKHRIGRCSLEPNKTRCQKSRIEFEEFRIYSWVNTVECNGFLLQPHEQECLIDELMKKENVKFKVLRKILKKNNSSYQFNYADTAVISGSRTIAQLSSEKFFGERWFSFSREQQEIIWHTIYFFNDIEKLKLYAIENWDFNEEQAEAISRFKLADGYSNLSLKAIKNILPFLKDGYKEYAATILGGVTNALGKRWRDYNQDEKDGLVGRIYEMMVTKKEADFITELKEMLKADFNLSEKELQKLYVNDNDQKKKMDRLPISAEFDLQINQLRNPVVQASLFELRKVTNAIVDKFGTLDQIKLEMVKEVKNSSKKRYEIAQENRRNETLNNKIKKKLKELGKDPTSYNVTKYKLWEECHKKCVFTNRSISVSQLFSPQIQIQYIIPHSKSLNKSIGNQVICFAEEVKRSNKTPYEFCIAQGERKWLTVKGNAHHCFIPQSNYPYSYKKYKLFIKEKHYENVVERYTTDLHYISKKTKSYLGLLVGAKNVTLFSGNLVHELKRQWGINTLLSTSYQKDYRSFALDALTISCMDRHYIKALTKLKDEKNTFPVPWEGFRIDADGALNRAIVSHRSSKKIFNKKTISFIREGKTITQEINYVRGLLHKESNYGRRTTPDGIQACHMRKPLSQLTKKTHIDKIVDEPIKKKILKKIEEAGGFIQDKKTGKFDKVPPGIFFIDDEQRQRPLIYLPNKNGAFVPIKKVRIRENLTKTIKLKEFNIHVNLRNNHHVLIYRDKTGKLHEEIVTFFEAIRRKLEGEPVIALPPSQEGEIVTSLQINEYFLLNLNEKEIDWNDHAFLSRFLFRVQALSSKNYVFRKHTEATLQGKLNVDYCKISSFGKAAGSWENFNPIKVRVDKIGNIEKA